MRRLVLGPAYSALMDALERPGSVNPRRVPDLVFQILDDSRPSSLNWLAARTICGLARTSFGRRRAEAIALHYDLPPEFYRIFLDSRYAAYTCGIFDAPGISLEEAQRRKFEILVRKLRPGPGDRIFELGSGWGAFLTFAKENGLNASGMALSREQIEHCHKRGLDVVYGDAAGGLPGPVDRLLAVGMFEHCKDKRGQILAECFRALKTGGRMVVQEMCSGAHPGEPAALAFAVEEFFHGDVLGDYHSVQRAARTAGFQVEHMECFGPHYVPTALEWARRLAEAFPAAAAMVGYRTAMSHLIAQAGFAWSFAVGSLDLLQYVLVKPEAGPSRRPHPRRDPDTGGQDKAMQCPACRQDTPAGARFCPSCGGALVSEGAPQSYTPRHLADKILTTRSALEGERKQVTVLFADVSGFTRFSDKRDPEEVHGVMTRALELMLDAVHRYEGTVNQFLGDGIMALFGAPIAHEDHTHRALRAALDIRRSLESYREELRAASGVDFQIRQGLNMGTVVVGSVGNDLRMDYTAVGDTTNVAARLVQAADAGRIFISAPVQRETEGYFYTRPLGEIAVKGKAEPIAAWELVGARQMRTRLEVQAEQGLAPFVGRSRELRQLQDLFARVRGGRGQVAFITGEPGIGKSRLLLELRARLGGEATWLEGHANAVGRGAAFHPLVDLMKRSFRIEESDNEEVVGRKIERGVLLLGEDMRPTLPYFRSLLSLGTGDALAQIEPRQQRANLFDAIRRLIVRAAAIHPQVFVIEDLHWMDDATEAFLLAAADTIPSNRVLCIFTYRSNYAHRLGEQPHYTTIALDTLSEEHSSQIARWILSAELLPADVAALITRVAEGNPFFVEEVVKTLREQGVVGAGDGRALQEHELSRIVIPGTVQSLIAARIDRLDDPAKRTLQAAAVIGRRFPLALLASTVEEEARAQLRAHVETLARLEFIFRAREGMDPEYCFKHALTQEVAYESLLQQRRRKLHGRVAAALEIAGRESLEEHLPALAYHYSRSADEPKAIEYLVRAGDQAVRLYANAAAKLHFADAHARLQRRPDLPARDATLIDVTIRLCGVSDSAAGFEQDLARLNDALVIARSSGDRARESRLLYWLGRTFYTTGQTTRGTEPAEQALAIADDLGDEKLAALPVNLLGRLYFLSDFKKACPMLERSMRLIDPANHVEIALARGGLGWSQAMIGAFGPAIESVNAGLSLAQRSGHVPTIAGCHMYCGCALASRGDWPDATAAMREALVLAQKAGDHFRMYLTTGFLGGYLVMQGDYAQGMDLLERMVGMAQKIGTRLGLHNAYVYMAESQLLQGRASEAAETAQKAIGMAIDTQQRWTEGWARRVLGQALMAGAGPNMPMAEKELLESVRIFEDLGTLPDLARALFAYGTMLESAGRKQKAASQSARARTMFADMGMSWDLQRAGG